MDVTDFEFSLRWPQELFIWEARRIAAMRTNSSFADMVVSLLAEAFTDGDIALSVDQARKPSASPWGTQTPEDDGEAGQVLDALITNQGLLRAYEPPQYWLERQGRSSTVVTRKTLAQAFVELIGEMREGDYFPKLLPKPCVDDSGSWEVDPSSEMSKAIRASVSWPLDESRGSIPDEVLYSVIEFFHDHAQRPRTRSLHTWAGCGWHYADHNKESGGVVYRWRVNELLGSNSIGLRLGNKGTEKGRLIRHASLQLDELADELSDDAAPDTDDAKITSAIRLYRARASSVHDRRGALAQLAGHLEKYRQDFKAGEFTRGDESDLFNIFNNFAIRHDRASQKSDYGEEYLDWVFWTTLAGIRLLKELRGRKD